VYRFYPAKPSTLIPQISKNQNMILQYIELAEMELGGKQS
jgi:hypothetical protein